MLEDERLQPKPEGDKGLSAEALSAEAASLDRGRQVADVFRRAVSRVTEFIAEFTRPTDTSTVDMDKVRQIVSEARPYLGATESGVVFYKAELSNAASTIQRVLYDIPRSNGEEDFNQRVKPHRDFIDDAIWKPLLGKSFLDSVRDHFQREGVHCDSPEILARESEFFVAAVARGDTSRFATFLMWCLKDDPKLIDKIMPRLG